MPADASKEEIKRAYRKRAKELHPDINPNRDAHEQFILLNEAYEYLTNPQAGKRRNNITYEDWVNTQRETARARAREHARMRYEEFKKTDYYKKSEALHTVVEHFYLLSCILLLLSPVILAFIFGIAGFITGLFILFFNVHYWADMFTDNFEINLKSFRNSLVSLLKSKTFSILIISFINIYFFTQIVLNTQIKFSSIVLSIILLYFGIYLLDEKYKFLKKISPLIAYLCVLPIIFNLFFIINYAFSSNPVTEQYSFVHEQRWYGGRLSSSRLEKISTINLENKKYEEYKWFRVFYDFEAMKDKKEIRYTFEDGLFRLRVLKKYEFTR